MDKRYEFWKNRRFDERTNRLIYPYRLLYEHAQLSRFRRLRRSSLSTTSPA